MTNSDQAYCTPVRNFYNFQKLLTMTLSLGNTFTEKGRFIPSIKFLSQETSGLGTVLRNSDVVSYTKIEVEVEHNFFYLFSVIHTD